MMHMLCAFVPDFGAFMSFACAENFSAFHQTPQIVVKMMRYLLCKPLALKVTRLAESCGVSSGSSSKVCGAFAPSLLSSSMACTHGRKILSFDLARDHV